jgi:hypothetical protein
MHLPRISTSKKPGKSKTKSSPSWRLFRVVARCEMRPAGCPQSQQRMPFPEADPWSPEQRLRSPVEAPIPAPVWNATGATWQLFFYQGGAAGQSQPPIVLRRLMTDGNASSELAISLPRLLVSGCLSVSEHLLVLVFCQSSLRTAANSCTLPLFPLSSAM